MVDIHIVNLVPAKSEKKITGNIKNFYKNI